VAGMGAMSFPRFLLYSVIAAVIWVGVCVGAGHLFGGLEIVKKNFSLAVLAVIGISLLPAIYEIIRHRMKAKSKQSS
jgi:membrane-associated protein